MHQNDRNKAQQIDAILPQTQCGLCGYDGCMPYALAIANHEAAINLCPPGGVPTLIAIAKLVEQTPEPFIADMERKTKAKTMAIIREDECIGCTKCIQACPVDAILGGAKQMHTVISDECTGCELCVPPCPVDCIDLLLQTKNTNDINSHKADQARERFNARKKRLERKTSMQKLNNQMIDDKIKYIRAAISRVNAKKNMR